MNTDKQKYTLINSQDMTKVTLKGAEIEMVFEALETFIITEDMTSKKEKAIVSAFKKLEELFVSV